VDLPGDLQALQIALPQPQPLSVDSSALAGRGYLEWAAEPLVVLSAVVVLPSLLRLKRQQLGVLAFLELHTMQRHILVLMAAEEEPL
jgi:hypothetical protein